MTRRVRHRITAVVSIAAAALVVGLTTAAHTGGTHPNMPQAGISFNALD